MTNSYVFFEMLSEQQRDRKLNEEPGVLRRQLPPRAGDEVLIGTERPWRVVGVETYQGFYLAWIVLSGLPLPDKGQWITEIRKEFFPENALSICATPNLKILEWGAADPDSHAEARLGERLYDHRATGKVYQVAGIESEVIEAVPSEWAIDRVQSFTTDSPSNSYTRIDFYCCESSLAEVAA